MLLSVFLFGCASKGNLPPPTELEALDRSLSLTRDWLRVNIIERERSQIGQGIYVDESLFLWVDGQGRLHAQDAVTGDRRWVVTFDSKVSSRPGAHGDVVLVVTEDAYVLALDKKNGSELWRTRVSSESLVAPQVAEGLVIVYCVDGKIFALNFSDGVKRWRYDSDVPVVSLRGNATPTLFDGRVFVGLSEGELASLALWSGKESWKVPLATPRGRTELERMVDVDTTPVVFDGVVYSGAYQGQVAALQIRTGRVIWAHEMSTAKDIAVDSAHVYVVDDESVLYALDRKSGQVLWKQDALQWRYITAPTLYKGYLVVGDIEGYLHWLDAQTGELAHRVRSDYTNIDAKPVVARDRLYAMSRAGIIDVLMLDEFESVNAQ